MSISLVIFQNNCSEVKCMFMFILWQQSCNHNHIWHLCLWQVTFQLFCLGLVPAALTFQCGGASSQVQLTVTVHLYHSRATRQEQYCTPVSPVSPRIRANRFTYSPPNRNINLLYTICPVVFIMQSYCKYFT